MAGPVCPNAKSDEPEHGEMEPHKSKAVYVCEICQYSVCAIEYISAMLFRKKDYVADKYNVTK